MTNLILALLMAVPMQEPDRDRNRKGPQEVERLKRQAQELELKAAELTRALKELEGAKREEAENALAEVRASIKQIMDQIARLDPVAVAPPRREPDPREKELADRIARIQKRIQAKEFQDERELEKLMAEQRQLESELSEVRAHGREMRGMHQPSPVPPMNEVQRARMLDEVAGWLKENEPHTAEQLNILWREKRWDEHERLLRDAYGRMKGLQELKQRDPKEFERVQKMNRMEGETRRLGEDLRRMPKDDPKRSEVKQKLLETLNELFEMRESARWRELEALEAQVKELRKTLETRKENKQKIVEKRARELGGEKDETDW